MPKVDTIYLIQLVYITKMWPSPWDLEIHRMSPVIWLPLAGELSAVVGTRKTFVWRIGVAHSFDEH